MVLNQEAIQICPICEERSVVVWYGMNQTKLFCLECGRFWIEAEDVKSELVSNRHEIHFQGLTLLEGDEDTYGKELDERNKQLDKEVEWIVEGAISKIIMASLASGIPCDPDTSDGIRSIESCLEKMKKEMNK